MIKILAIKIDGHSVYVTGTIDGETVTAHGWASRVAGVSDEERKKYLELILREHAKVERPHFDAILDDPDPEPAPSWQQSAIKWGKQNWITVAVSVILSGVVDLLIDAITWHKF